MKRWLLFGALFLAGLGVLWWIDRSHRREPRPPEPTKPPDAQSNPGAQTKITTKNGQTALIESDGPFQSDEFDKATGKLLYRITAKNHTTVGEGIYDFENVVGRFFVPGTEQLQMEFSAERARGKLTSFPKIDFDRAYPMQLDGVVATLLEGSPLTPLVLRVPHATGTFADQTISSKDHVEITGTGLFADGMGLAYSGVSKELKLEHDTHASLVLGNDFPAKISALGGLTLTNLEKSGIGATRVVARDHAHLTFEGKEPLVVDADEVTLDGQATKVGKSAQVKPTKVSAHGSVRLAPKDGEFFGNDAQLDLDPEGHPLKARLEGAPRVELVLRDVDTTQVPGVVAKKSSDLPVKMIGTGPLDVTLVGDAHFDFGGPATLLLPTLEMNLTAQEKLSGTRHADSEFGRLDAFGNVEVHHADSETLTSNSLSIERKLTQDGQVAAHLTTEGSTHATGALEDGGTFDLTALNGLEFVRLPKSFQVPLAREVDLIVAGVNPFHAKAHEVRDLDGHTRSMTGIGNVFFDNDRGHATGERVVAKNKDSIELFGAPSALAHCDFEQGTLDAQSLDFEGDRLRAEGEAKAVVGVLGSDYHLHSRWIELQRRANGAGLDISLEAGGEVGAQIKDGRRTLDFSAEHVVANAYSATPKLKAVESRGLEATGGVDFHVSGDEELTGNGERLVIEADRSGRLYPAEHQRVQLSGHLPKDDLSFRMGSGVVHFAPQSLSAEDPAIEIEGVEAPLGDSKAFANGAPLHAVAGAMSVDAASILFTEGVYIGQTATPESTWSLDAENLMLNGVRTSKPSVGAANFNVTTVLAWGGFQARFAEEIFARGSSMLLDREQNRLTLRGTPAEFDLKGWRIGTAWLEVDLTTGFWRAAKGSAASLDQGSGSFELQFLSMEPMNGVDSRIEVVREPRFIDHKNQRETRAAWALFWLDERRLQRLSLNLLHRPDLGLPVEPPPGPAPAKPRSGLVQQMQALPFLKGVHEAYFEGNIEVLEKGMRRIQADSLYLDFVDGHGWMRDFTLSMDTPFRSGAKHLKVHADWLSFSAEGLARAHKAVATSCEFDEPHYVIRLGDLRMKPRPSENARKAIAAGRNLGSDETEGYDVTSKNNSVQFGDSPQVPMPEIAFPMDADYNIPPDAFTIFGIRGLSLGNVAKFGAFFGLTFDVPLGWFSDQVHNVLGKASKPTSGGNTADVKYLNARGLLLSGENTIEEKGVYKLSTRLSTIYDNGADKGLVRVPTADRDSLRAWLRVRGRRLLGSTEWIDLNLTVQTDPGVQAEFFERDFLRWEERETYLHWRKARGLDYWRATLETQLDNYRTEVIEQPSLGFTRARGPIARWWGRDIVYSADTSVAHLRRIEGDPRFNEQPFADGFGNEEVLRLDSSQRLERPMPLGVLNARLVPFVEARATAWDKSPTSSQAPSRFALLAGAELSTTFWRLYGDGDLHSLTPTISVHGDLDLEENGRKPAQFDGVEDSIQGRFTEIGLRSRWTKPHDMRRPDALERLLDIELREAYGDSLGGGKHDGWQPLRVNAQWLSEVFGIPFGALHDARYDLEADQTTYSRSTIGVRPVKPLEIETGFNSARDLSGARLYSAWSLAARYAISDKWQVEGKETISTLSNSRLDSNFLLRRIGHDFVVELSYSFTAGEGGSSVSFSLIPMLTYREPGLGMLSHWQAEGN